ncbi:MAG TPA: hypothetical protein VL096_11570 [Pirellulaceae bacterium]|nr:hypothetical protein [Pirellulaceae bacterium]
MGRLGSFLGGIVIGGAAVFIGLKYHVVRANDGVHLIPKLEARFDDAYVDIRKFSFEDWNQHRSLAVAMTQSQKGYLMQETATDSLRQSVDSVLQGLGKYTGSTAPAAPEPSNPFGKLPSWRPGS